MHFYYYFKEHILAAFYVLKTLYSVYLRLYAWSRFIYLF